MIKATGEIATSCYAQTDAVGDILGTAEKSIFACFRFFQSPSLEATFGGGEANVAVSLANYGMDAAFVTALPNNAIGEACRRDVRSFGGEILEPAEVTVVVVPADHHVLAVHRADIPARRLLEPRIRPFADHRQRKLQRGHLNHADIRLPVDLPGGHLHLGILDKGRLRRHRQQRGERVPQLRPSSAR